MLQPMLLLELFLLAATAYLFWQLRRIATGSAKTVPPKPDYLDERASIELAQEMTDLLAELQSVAEVIRREAQTRQADLRQAIDQAQAAQDQLQTLIEQQSTFAGTRRSFRDSLTALQATSPPRGQVLDLFSARDRLMVRPPILPTQHTQNQHKVMFCDALQIFNSHLASTGHNDRTITRIVGHVREFAIWLGGTYYDELRLGQINAAKIAAYLSELEAQNHRSAAINRVRTSLEQFVEWLEQPDKAQPMIVCQTDTLVGRDRYQAVLELAQQGLDQSGIAAKTGLAQEAIRMVLAREKVA